MTPATSVGLHSAPSLASYAHHTSRPSPSDRGNSTQTRPINSMTDLWVAPHLLAQENQVTLRERNLTERHLPGSRPTPPTRPPHMRTRQSRNDSAASQSRTIETRLSEASFSTDAVDDNVSVPDYLTGSPPRTSNQIGTWTHSVVSSGSLAAVPTMSTNSQSNIGTRAVRTQVFNAFDPQGNAHRRMLERASTETSTAAAPSAHTITDRSKPVRGNFARPVSHL